MGEFDLPIPFSYRLSQMMYLDLKEVGSVEAQMLPWQHASYFSLNLVRNIYDFNSIIC